MIRIFRRLLSVVFTLHLRRTSISCGPGVRANGLVLARNLHVGANCHFNGMRVFGRGRVSIGDNFHSGRGLKILTETHNYNGTELPYDDQVITRDVTIGRNVWIGMDVRVLAGVRIGEGAIIQAGSTVVSDVAQLSIVGGHPARVFKQRDPMHYHRLADPI